MSERIHQLREAVQVMRYVTALEIPPVESPQTAVRAAIASKAQK
jgi:hypothetical protein